MAMSDAPDIYPAVFHFSVVAETPFAHCQRLLDLLADHDVTAPFEAGPPSKSGRYATFRASVRLASREQLEALTAALGQVPGVRMVL